MKNSESGVYSVERIAYRKKLSAKRYPLNAETSLFFIIATFFLHFNCYAQSISSAELINNAKDYDGKNVVYAGEVIGDIMARGEYAWINVNDGKNAIGIWLKKDLTKNILNTGNYKFRGDEVEAAGIFHRACLEHGGDLDIHAQSLKKISAGYAAAEKLNTGKRRLAFILLGALCIVLILRRLKRK